MTARLRALAAALPTLLAPAALAWLRSAPRAELRAPAGPGRPTGGPGWRLRRGQVQKRHDSLRGGLLARAGAPPLPMWRTGSGVDANTLECAWELERPGPAAAAPADMPKAGAG
uniref:Uncharacterized protein n=1 Tax=Pyrodinium bahamense TaxID=73915 RepID=A0A7S0A181_9DINO|mmetsp:Transcript_18481/g.50895  ORF Transcript_18481/g.50895 Transcript_18481/m.50895 type:complete len:114 (+) Transcript_18481:60-401(+)